MYRLMVSAGFAAAHQLRGYEGKCENLHGHNWKVQLYVTAEDLDKVGLAVDFKELKRSLRSILSGLDHTFLNNLPPFQIDNPSSENIARYIFQQVVEALRGKAGQVSSVRVWESENAYAEYFQN